MSAGFDNSIQNLATEGLENNSIVGYGKNSCSSRVHASWVDASLEMLEINVPDPQHKAISLRASALNLHKISTFNFTLIHALDEEYKYDTHTRISVRNSSSAL